jgi:signal transduction histidine kinase
MTLRAADHGYGRFVRTLSDGQRPPLTKRLRPRHWAALDYLAGALLGVVLFAVVRHMVTQTMEAPYLAPSGTMLYPVTWPLAVFLVAVAAVAVALRRRHPAAMLGVLLVSSLLVSLMIGPQNGALVYFLPVSYVLYLVAATYGTRRTAMRVLACVFGTIAADAVLLEATGNGFLGGNLIPVALCVTIAWFTGYTVRQRRSYAVRLQDEAASKAVTEERLRIARELHDVVAHSMSVIAVQAGYGQYVIDTQPSDARSALGAIQATSREALDEMRRMLGALRQADHDLAAEAGGAADPESAPLLPAPGLADLDRLVSRTARAGVQVEVTRCGQPGELPASIDMSAYRIVQEALTNVVKHARTSSCRVLIGYRPDELTLEITDNGAGVPAMAGVPVTAGVPAMAGAGAMAGGAAGGAGLGTPQAAALMLEPGSEAGGGSGHGIIGMRERVTLLGGEFSAGPLPGYGFQVIARIPLPS